MKAEEKKNILKTSLINSFVDDYNAYKSTIIFINKELKELNINYQYTYDEFCLEFLNKTLENIEFIDLQNIQSDFFINFWKFNLYNIQSMLNKKIENYNENKINQ